MTPYINTTVVFLDITHRPVFIGTSSIDWAQLSRFNLKMETESSPKHCLYEKGRCFK
jgi:hypothetical protein